MHFSTRYQYKYQANPETQKINLDITGGGDSTQATKINSRIISGFRHLVTLGAVAGIGMATFNPQAAFSDEQQNPPSQEEIQDEGEQNQTNGQKTIAANRYNQNQQYNRSNTQQKINFPAGNSTSSSRNSASSIRVYADVLGGENSSRALGQGGETSNQASYKAGVELNIQLGNSPENTSDRNSREQSKLAMLDALKGQVMELCNPNNLQLSEAQCTVLKAKLSQAIMSNLDNVNK